MESQATQLRIFFLPFLAPGHMIPMVDLARLFARHGVDATIITTPANAYIFQNAIDRDMASGYNIRNHIVPFPSAQVGLPEGVENFATVTKAEMCAKLYYGIHLLQKTTEQFFESMKPDCVVTDMFYPWTVDAAERLGIPRLIFQGSSYFSQCAAYSVKMHEPHKDVESDSEKFVLPGIPDRIEMTRMQLPDWVKTHTPYTKIRDLINDAEKRSYGAIMNSFVKLEGAYEDNYMHVSGIKTWSVGPISSWVNRDVSDKVQRGNKTCLEEHECLSWLDGKEAKSVLYVSFGSSANMSSAQLMEIAHALESSGHFFIWVVRRKIDKEDVGWLPEGFKERMKRSAKGLVIEGWAPQLLILDHPAIGAFVTHCGWNSVIESINSGLPMITWPMFAEQFYNERLVVDVVKTGVAVGVPAWNNWTEEARELVPGEKFAECVSFLMGNGQEAAEMRKRAIELGKEAKKAVEEGGSSKANLLALIDHLKSKSKHAEIVSGIKEI